MEVLFNYYNYIIILIIVSSITIGLLFYKNKHFYRIKTGYKILKKIRSFTDPNKNLKIINYLRKIDPFTFEELLLSLFKESGCKIKRNKRYTGDGGIDGKFHYDKEKYFVQAKRYTGYIKLSDVQIFSNTCLKNKVKGVFIHTGKTGKGVHEFLIYNKNIVIINPENLVEFIINGNVKISN